VAGGVSAPPAPRARTAPRWVLLGGDCAGKPMILDRGEWSISNW